MDWREAWSLRAERWNPVLTVFTASAQPRRLRGLEQISTLPLTWLSLNLAKWTECRCNGPDNHLMQWLTQTLCSRNVGGIYELTGGGHVCFISVFLNKDIKISLFLSSSSFPSSLWSHRCHVSWLVCWISAKTTSCNLLMFKCSLCLNLFFF